MKRLIIAAAALIAWCSVSASAQNVTVIGPITPGDCAIFNSVTVIKDAGFTCVGGPGGTLGGVLAGSLPNPTFSTAAFANPTATVGLTAVNGSALTAMRSDAAPPLSASVQAALSGTAGQLLVGTGGFGFAAAPNAALRTKLPTGVTNFYANSSATGCTGSVPCLDTNDGLTPGTAKKTVLGALYGVLNGYDFSCNVAAQSVAQINLLSNEINAGQSIHFGPHDYPGACAGESVTVDGGGFTLQYDSASGANPFQIFFGPAMLIQNIAIANNLGPCVTLYEHASVRFGAGVNFGNCGIGLQVRTGSVATFQNNFTITTTGSFTAFIECDENGVVEFSPGLTVTKTNNVTWVWTVVTQQGGVVDLNNVTWAGAGVVTAQKFLATDGSVILHGAANLPGGTAGVTNSGATADSAPVAVTAGGTGLAIGVSGAVPYFSSTTTIAASALLTNHAPLVGGGAGAAPKSIPVGLTGQALLGVTGADPAFGSLRQIIPINNGTVAQSQNTTAFQVTIANGGETNVQVLCPIGGTFRNLFVQTSPAPAAGQTLIATMRVNGADTALTCTITGAGNTCSDVTHSAACTAGQTYSLKTVTSATSGSINGISVGVEFDNP